MTINSARNILNYFVTPKSILVSAGIAGVCHYTGLPCLLKVKQVATGLAVTGAAIYTYLKRTEEGSVDSNPNIRGGLERLPDAQGGLIEAGKQTVSGDQTTKAQGAPAAHSLNQDESSLPDLVDKIASDYSERGKQESTGRLSIDLWNALLKPENSLKASLDVIFKHKDCFDVLCGLIQSDDRIYSPRKKEILSSFYNRLAADPRKRYFSSLLGDLARVESYLLENQIRQFVRKVPPRGMLSSIPESFLEKPLFLDDEILTISKIKGERRLTPPHQHFVRQTISENGKSVIQQQAAKSCGPTCVCMLLADHTAKLSDELVKDIYQGHLTNDEDLVRLIEKEGFNTSLFTLESLNKREFLEKLRNQLKMGSAIIDVGGMKEGRIGGHFVICDEISDDLKKVRLRDPCHGWEITVKAEAFLDAVSREHGPAGYSTEILQLSP